MSQIREEAVREGIELRMIRHITLRDKCNTVRNQIQTRTSQNATESRSKERYSSYLDTDLSLCHRTNKVTSNLEDR